MAAIRAFTTIEQSRKLAEILPLESADMHYHYDYDFDELESIPIITEENDHFVLFPKDIRCWSLAALLSVIPYNVSISRAVYRFKLIKFYDHWESYYENFGRVSTEIFKAKEAIDAVYAMILELHKLKLLRYG